MEIPEPNSSRQTNQNTKSRPGSRHHSRRGTSTEPVNGPSGVYDADNSWLTRTASTLALHTMEEKGQSWLASRTSATSLSHAHIDTYHNTDASSLSPDSEARIHGRASLSRSTPQSRHASRVQSRVGSTVGSRSDLRMTRTEAFGMSARYEDTLQPKAQGLEDIEPDFVDLDERDREDGEGVDIVDEGEMRRLILGRVGGWVDWMVGWMDFRGVGDDGETGEGEMGRGEMDVEGSSKGEGRDKQRLLDGGDESELDKGVGIPAPESGGGVWEDTKWFLKVAANSL
ncbi:MAG: hypothetical protein Q9172_005573 [Xanthocarpia lactea]